MTNQVPFQTVVDALLDTTKPFATKYLPFFSDIDPVSLKLTLEAWPRVALTRKRTLLADLDALFDTDTIVSFDDFASALLDDPDGLIRAAAIRLLAECEDVKLIPVYAKMLASDPDVAVRAEAANILNLYVDLGEQEEISEKALRQAEDALLAAVHDDSATVRRRVIESLGYSSRPEVPPLIEAAFDRGTSDWLASALTAMGRSQDARWIEPIISMLLNDDPAVRLEAARAAGELELDEARMPLLRLLEEEEDEEVISAAIWSLSQIGGEDVRIYLEHLLDTTEDEDEVEIAFLEDAIANLSFTEDLEKFDLLAFNPDDELKDVEELDELDEEDEKPKRKKKS